MFTGYGLRRRSDVNALYEYRTAFNVYTSTTFLTPLTVLTGLQNYFLILKVVRALG